MPLLLVAALVGCGSDSSSDDASGSAKSGAAGAAEAKKLLDETFGPNDKASSGKLSGTVDIDVKGAPRYREPIQVTMSGPFSSSGGAPEANLSVGLQLRGGGIGGELVLIDDRVLIGLGTTGYQIPADIASIIRKPLGNSDNALASVLAVFGIAPQRWAKNPRVIGNATINGEKTIYGQAKIDTQRFFLDVARLAKVLTKLRITEVTGLPRELDRQTRQALERSVQTATGKIYTGADDKVLRRALFDMRLKTSAKDRKILKFDSVTVKGQLDVTEVGSDQRIEAPKSTGSYDALQVTLDALAEAVK